MQKKNKKKQIRRNIHIRQVLIYEMLIRYSYC